MVLKVVDSKAFYQLECVAFSPVRWDIKTIHIIEHFTSWMHRVYLGDIFYYAKIGLTK